MKLVVGLGNPGGKHKNSRHNVGFLVVDKLVGNRAWLESQKNLCWYSWLDEKQSETEVVKPATFINKSGEALIAIKKKHPGLKDEEILVIHDDLDIALGTGKLQFGKGPRQHNGVLSVENELGTKGFWRLRVGIDSRSAASGQRPAVSGEEYVLQDFTPKEREILDQIIEIKIIPEIKNWLLKK